MLFTQDVTTKKLLAKKKINIEETVKKLLRAFRRCQKHQFDSLFKRKHYHWVDTVVRDKTLQFYTTLKGDDCVEPQAYVENEEAFFKLIHNNWDNKSVKKSKKNSFNPEEQVESTGISLLYKEVFGQHPNKVNLKKMFSNPAIKHLWLGSFQKHFELKLWKEEFARFPKDQQAKFRKYMS